MLDPLDSGTRLNDCENQVSQHIAARSASALVHVKTDGIQA
jgi:hypothetical protein